jgi:cytochrome P450
VLNHEALCKDVSAFNDVNSFKPERWLEPLDGHQSDLTHELWQLGGGRPVCVGYRVAQKSLFINMSCLIYCFDYEAVGISQSMSFSISDFVR